MVILLFLVVAFCGATTAHEIEKRASDKSSNFKVVCYYGNWAVYRRNLARFTPQNINPYLCTHVIYAFGGFSNDFVLKPFDKYNDIEQGNYKKFIDLKSYNPKLKALLAIGGWNEGSGRFSPLVASSETREKFVQSAVRFLRSNGFDGLDLDWEYPTFRDGSDLEDRQGYALLIKELRKAFDGEKIGSGKQRLLLSVAVPAGQEYIDQGYDVQQIAKYVDFLNLLTYDYHTAYEPTVNHHAPLFKRDDLDDWDYKTKLNIDWTVNYYLELGAPKEKLILGIPTYGRGYTIEEGGGTDLGTPAKGPGDPGPATKESGYMAYYEICQKIKDEGWTVERPYPNAMGPYAHKDDQWIGYDDEEIVKKKAQYIKDKKLGGAMFWSLDNDDFRGQCGGQQSPLITAVRSVLFSRGGGKINENAISRKLHKNEVPAGAASTNTESTAKARISRPRTSTRATTTTRRVFKTSPRTTTTTTAEPDFDPIHTPPPPPTPDPGPAFECKDSGFYPNPVDCKKYFWCLDSGPANLGLVAHAFTCPSGLYFNKRTDACDYPDRVKCRVTAQTTATPTTTRATTRRTTTTTTTSAPEEEEEEEEPQVTTLSNKQQNNLSDLLKLIDQLGGVEGVQKYLEKNGGDKDELASQLKGALPDRRDRNRPVDEDVEEERVVNSRPPRPRGRFVPEEDEDSPSRRVSSEGFKRNYVTITRTTTSAPRDDSEEEETEKPTTTRRTTTTSRPRTTTRKVEERTTSKLSRTKTTPEEETTTATALLKPRRLSRRPINRKSTTTTTTTTTTIKTPRPGPRIVAIRRRPPSSKESQDGDIDTVGSRVATTVERAPPSITESDEDSASSGATNNFKFTTLERPPGSTPRSPRQNPVDLSAEEERRALTNLEPSAIPLVSTQPSSSSRPVVLPLQSQSPRQLTIVQRPFPSSTTVQRPFPSSSTPLTPPPPEYEESDEIIGEEEFSAEEDEDEVPVILSTTTPATTTTTTTTVRTTRFRLVTATRPRTTPAPPRPTTRLTARTTRRTTTRPLRTLSDEAVDDVTRSIDPDDHGHLTVDESGRLHCNIEGVFEHPISCNKFVNCVQMQGNLRAWTYTCPPGLLYDDNVGHCNWQEQVDCAKRK